MSARTGGLEVVVTRGDVVESRHAIRAAVVDGEGVLTEAFGDVTEPTFLRSGAKPLQAAVALAHDAFPIARFVDEHARHETIAILAASHAGRPEHVAAVARALAAIGLDERALLCGAHPPFDGAAVREVGEAFGPLHHNCSGNHAGMLGLALAVGEPVARYLDPSSRGQQAILAGLAAASSLDAQTIPVATDGCGAPTFALPLVAAARLALALVRPEALAQPLAAALGEVATAMRRQPGLVGGPGRLDTTLGEVTEGRLLAKSGAEGVELVARVDPPGAFALKVVDGAARAVGPATVALLERLGWLAEGERERIEPLASPVVSTSHGPAGRLVARFHAGVAAPRW